MNDKVSPLIFFICQFINVLFCTYRVQVSADFREWPSRRLEERATSLRGMLDLVLLLARVLP